MSICLNSLITTEPLSTESANDWLNQNQGKSGAIVLFSGLVRSEQNAVQELILEHYPGMTERVLAELTAKVSRRWPLQRTLAWHRVGSMQPGDIIVLVGIAAMHRSEAFEAASCLMDLIKTQVPLWKKIQGPAGSEWVDARDKDLAAAARWSLD